MINLYDNIRKRRQQLNMTQEQLAEKTGYASKSMISKIEKGLIKLDHEKIEDFAKALRMDPVELMGYVFEPFKPEVQKEIDAFMARQEKNKEPWEHIEQAALDYQESEGKEDKFDRMYTMILRKAALMSLKELEDVVNYVKFVEWKRKQKGSE
jgi:transcriptional regulator with XRE-family HTH domain